MRATIRRAAKPPTLPTPPSPTRITHEAEPVEVREGGAVRVLRGRVQPSAGGLSLYLFGLLRWTEFEPEVAEGFVRERVWLEPRGEWCRYEAVDRAT